MKPWKIFSISPSIILSGCHWTPRTKVSPGSSIASMTPSGAHAARARDPHRVRRIVQGRLRTVLDGSLDLAWDVLVEGATRCDVEDLVPPADGEDGLPDFQGLPGYLQLEVVPLGIDPPHVGDGVLSVELGIDIHAAREDQAIHSFKELLHVDLERGRKDDRSSPASLDCVNVRVGDRVTVVIPVVGGGYPYQGSHMSLVKEDFAVYECFGQYFLTISSKNRGV